LFAVEYNLYIKDNRLIHYLKLPKLENLIIEPLTPEEMVIALDVIDQKKAVSRRNHVIVVLMLDTGLHASEVVSARLKDFNPIEGCTKVMNNLLALFQDEQTSGCLSSQAYKYTIPFSMSISRNR